MVAAGPAGFFLLCYTESIQVRLAGRTIGLPGQDFGIPKGDAMKILQATVLTLLVAAHPGSLAMADTGIPWVGWIEPTSSQEASVFVLPDGSGPPLTEAKLYGGLPVDATIVVGLTDNAGYPIPYFPWQDIWLDAEVPTDFVCMTSSTHGFSADANTDTNGETLFATSLAGGGWSEGPMWVYLNGDRAIHPGFWVHPPVALRFNSADIDGDGVVNLTDVSYFAIDFYGAYNYRSDFLWDGTLNLADVQLLAAGVGIGCE